MTKKQPTIKLEEDSESKIETTKSKSKKTSEEISENFSHPEQEFIEICDNEIKKNQKEIKKIEEKRTKMQESLPSMDKNFTENLCLKALSDILSEGELNIVKKWRTNEDLEDIYEHTKSYRDSLAEKILDWLKDLDEDRKIIFARYLSKKRIICCWDSDYNFWFYYTDIDSERCDETINTINKLWLRKYVWYVWDSCYNIDKKYIETAQKRIFDATLTEDDKKSKEQLELLEKESSSLESKIFDIEMKKYAVELYWLPVERAVSILSWEEGIDRPKDKKFDKENNTYVILSDYSYYSWSWWIEYWVIINVKRWSNTKELKIKYRDAYSSSNDDWSKNYEKIKDVRTQWDKVLVTVSSRERTQTYEFNIQDESKKEHLLNAEEQSSFKKRYEEETKRLIDENTKHNLKYPAIHNFTFRKIPWAFSTDWMHPYNTEMPYDKAEIVDKYIDTSKGIAYVVIKSQIDSSWDMWRQFKRTKYAITNSTTREIEKETLWELSIIEGEKPSLRAKE